MSHSQFHRTKEIMLTHAWPYTSIAHQEYQVTIKQTKLIQGAICSFMKQMSLNLHMRGIPQGTINETIIV